MCGSPACLGTSVCQDVFHLLLRQTVYEALFSKSKVCLTTENKLHKPVDALVVLS